MGILEAARRFRANEKLDRGQCQWCKKPLRDDEHSGFCSDDCHKEHMAFWTI